MITEVYITVDLRSFVHRKNDIEAKPFFLSNHTLVFNQEIALIATDH